MKWKLFVLVFVIVPNLGTGVLIAQNRSDISDFHSEENRKERIDSAFVASFKNDSLSSFYQKNNFDYVWKNSEQKITISTFLSGAFADGLNPEEYQAKEISSLLSTKRPSDLEKEKLDVLLTFGLQKFLNHRINGKLNPVHLYEDWDLKQHNSNINQLIFNAIEGDSIVSILKNSEPRNLNYLKLKHALEIIDTFPDQEFLTISSEKNIKPNDSGMVVKQIKERLLYWNDLKKTDSLTSTFDDDMFVATKKFQRRHGLQDDGVIGPATLKQLNISKADRKAQIIANLERWRWFPRKMSDHYLLLNIPDYKIHAIKNSDTIRSHNVIVGTIARKTPILSSKLSYAVLNPTWTVPPTILREDVVPAATKNRNYFAGKNIKIYNGSGAEVSAWAWNPEKANNYRYVQSPGTFNSLGMVKIIFPNHYSVYLHDTNHREYFDKVNRSLSSGCVRVQDPLELTEYLLDNKIDWSLEKITEILQNGKTQNAKIKNNVLIHQLYWTAWSEGNTLQFRPDIYELDMELYRKLLQ